jgi:hypothetical protein
MPPAKPSKILKGTGYPRKKKQNRKNNQSLKPVPVENPVNGPGFDLLLPLLSLITSQPVKGIDYQVLHFHSESFAASKQFYKNEAGKP